MGKKTVQAGTTTNRQQPRQPRRPKVLKLGSDFSGLETASVAMGRMGINHSLEFVGESDSACMSIIKKKCQPAHTFSDILERTEEEETYVDVYVWTPPYQDFASGGKQKGVKGPRKTGNLIKKSIQYIKRNKPRVTIFEKVPALTNKKFIRILKGIEEAQKTLGYVVHVNKLNSKDFGVPQTRERVFLVGVRQDSVMHPFTWPQKQATPPVTSILEPKRATTDVAGRPPSSERSRGMCKDAYKKTYEKKVDPRLTPVLVDIDCSKKFATHGINIARALTKTRGQDGGPRVSSRGRRATLHAMMRLQGFAKGDIPQAELDLSDRQIVHTMGAILSEALYSAGLTKTRAVNFDKHSRNPNHKAAAAAYARKRDRHELAASASSAEPGELQCPSESDFLDVVKLVTKGCGLLTTKNRIMLWCIQSALKQRDINIIKSILTPGLRFVIRDKAHSARRVVSRPWAADPYIKETAMIFARGRGSIARMIQNSPHIRQVFVNYTKMCRNKAINASMAKAWLKSVNTERCLMLAMMAGASDQAMQLTRILDDESANPAILNREVLAFNLSITGLFGSSCGCLSVFGYTTMMLKLLKIPIAWQVYGASYHIGDEAGVSVDIIDKCIARMRSYIVLARAALKAEFPTFELAQDNWAINASPSSSNNEDAWRSALSRKGARHLTASHPSDVLGRALVAFIAYGLSSSGVEQKFSQAALKPTDRMGKATADHEEGFLKVAMDFPESDQPEIIRMAQRAWRMSFGPPRASPLPPRIDTGVKRSAGPADFTEAGFIAKRRRAARGAAASVLGAERALAIQNDLVGFRAGAAWGGTREKELSFLNNKLRDKSLAAIHENGLLQHESSPALRADAAQKAAKQIADLKARQRRQARDAEFLRGASRAEMTAAIRGKTVYVYDSCRGRAGLERALREACLRIKRSFEADVFVVPKPGAAQPFITCASAVRGGFQVSPGFLISGRGPALKCMQVCHLKKTLYMSPGSNTKYCAFLELLFSRIPQCKWKIDGVSSWATLEAAFTGAKKSALLALVLPDELRQDAYKDCKNSFAFGGLAQKLASVDAARSCSGMQ
ncbi:unnamed protein product [Prorocentrum cordatum]|uniref:DNA (cytosine-5-)-methyltransferase n=1 Tax=Prorocentrum cordatum TaxID=2364126 RepID=A0ABN9W2Q5_9DINO|nr:unnamed protein product [Polarella glacialis]